jgi:membrane protein YqaA with SNARE-associated domain
MTNNEKDNSKTNIFLIVFLAIVIILTILCVIFPTFGEYFDLGRFFELDALGSVNYWMAIGFVMLLCFIGALIPIPIPYMLPVALFTVAWIEAYNYAWILIIGLVFFSALSNTIGDMIDYYIGRGTERVLSKDDPELQNRWSQTILKKPRIIPFIILIFGISPLPESLLMLPLGMVKYDVKKTVCWMFLGKIIMMLIMVLLGLGFSTIPILAVVLDFLTEGGSTGWITGIVTLYLMWIMILVMVKYKPKTSSNL